VAQSLESLREVLPALCGLLPGVHLGNVSLLEKHNRDHPVWTSGNVERAHNMNTWVISLHVQGSFPLIVPSDTQDGHQIYEYTRIRCTEAQANKLAPQLLKVFEAKANLLGRVEHSNFFVSKG
jgi:hypothetical protein